METNEKRTEKRTLCSTCEGFGIRICPWCKIDTNDENGKVIKSKPGQGCRACLGAGVFTCTQCDGKGYLSQDDIEIPGAPNKSGDRYLRDY